MDEILIGTDIISYNFIYIIIRIIIFIKNFNQINLWLPIREKKKRKKQFFIYFYFPQIFLDSIWHLKMNNNRE